MIGSCHGGRGSLERKPVVRGFAAFIVYVHGASAAGRTPQIWARVKKLGSIFFNAGAALISFPPNATLVARSRLATGTVLENRGGCLLLVCNTNTYRLSDMSHDSMQRIGNIS